MNDKCKILYIMNVDWRWIRQRPHIFAQFLDKKYELTVLYPKYITRPWRCQKNTQKPEKCIELFQIPFTDKISILNKLEEKKIKKAFASVMQYDILWFSSPLYIDYIPENYPGKIIYDDMDDIIRIQTNTMLASRLEQAQNKIFIRSDVIFVSSHHLLDHLPETVWPKSMLIRNGAFNQMLLPVNSSCTNRTRFTLGYIGTISEWFDFPLMKHCLTSYPELQLTLYGPNIVRIPQIPGIHCKGVVEHDKLAAAVSNIDCLIMPFVLNAITLAVDPVKLYEYISFGKCIISIRYPEIERFEPFVYFYETEEQFLELICRLIHKGFPPKYNAHMQKKFLDENSWEKRVDMIISVITTLQNRSKGENK